MKKILVSIFLFFFLFIFSAGQSVYSENEFSSDVGVHYYVSDHGTTTITYNVILTNNVSDLYATSYILNLTGTKPINPRAIQNGKPLDMRVDNKESVTELKINFTDTIVGKGNKRNFEVIFEDNTIATRTGEVWEIIVPRLSTSESFSNYNVSLSIPNSFGELAYMSPDANNSDNVDDRKVYHFTKSAITKTGVVAAFGQFQVFEFNLDYHLENPLNKTAIAEIAIPPDTAYQKVSYTSLVPKPETVTIDPDGNWIAVYKLKARERVDVKAIGTVQIFAGPRYKMVLNNQDRIEYLKETSFWQTNSEIVQTISRELNTPRQIYDYVVNTLKYDYDRVKPNVTRMGAEEALKHPNNAICMEFTDAFIALARARGIPAREINGYAYTENPELQPLSLVSDVLHSWPEYWDEEKQVWVPVDPTWGSTTGGVDFFTKLDLRHFSFVIHGRDPNKPYPPGSYKLGSNPQKDVYVNFGKLSESRTSVPQLSVKNKTTLSLVNSVYVVTIENPGPVAIDNKEIEVYFDDQKVQTQNIELLPPFSNTAIDVKVPMGFLGHNTPSKIDIFYGSQTATIPTQKTTVIIGSLVAIFVVIFGCVLYLFTKTLPRFKQNKINPNEAHGTINVWSRLFSRKKSSQ